MPPDQTLPHSWGGPAPVPEPGIYPGIPMSEYLSWDAASNSRLSALLRSPAHMKAHIGEPNKETDAFRYGRAVHAAVLEPDDFGARYVRGPEGDGRTKAVRDAKAALQADHPKAIILKPAEYDACLASRDSVWRKETAAGLLSGAGDVELSVVWDDEETGVRCKARWDRYSRKIAGGAVIDLKTTVDASPRSFERSLFRFGYHRQGAMYLMGARLHEAPVEHYAIIALEKDPPYGCAIYRLSDVVLSQVEDQVRALLRRYAECQTAAEWPDYPDEVRDLSIPAWAWDILDSQTAELEAA